MRHLIGVLVSLLVVTSLVIASAAAETYPDRPVRLIVPFAAGGGADVIARPLAQHLSEILGQQVVIDNRGGANGNIAAEEVAHASADGYTLLFANSSLPISVSLYSKLNFDVSRDFTPVGLVSISASVLVVNPSVPAHNIRELIEVAKRKPGQLNFGSSGRGSTMHLAGELFKSMAGVNLVHVPYRGAGPAIADLVGGHLQVVFVNIPPVLGNIRGNQVRALGVTTKARSKVLPDVPSLDESGLAGFESTTWYGVMGPASLPAPAVARLNQAIAQAVHSDDLRERLLALGSEPTVLTPEEFSAFVSRDIGAWAKVIKTAGVEPE